MNDISRTASVNAEASKCGDESIIQNENFPLEVLYSAPTKVLAPTIQQDDNDRYDLSTLSEANDECCSESFTGTCSTTDNIFQQIGHSFSNFFFGCSSRSPRGKRDLKEEDETYAHRTHVEDTTIGTITTDGSIECPSPCCSPTNLVSPSSMSTGTSMVAHPSLSSYQRGKSSSKLRVATNEESWDHAFRDGSFSSPTSTTFSKTNSRPSKTKKNGTAANKSSHHSIPKRGEKSYIRSARTIPSKKTAQTSEPSISDSSFYFHRSTTSKGGSSTASASRSKKDLAVLHVSIPATLQLSPMSSLSRSSTASSSRASKSRYATSSSGKFARPPGPYVPQVQRATHLRHIACSNQANISGQGLGVVTGKKRICLSPGYLHNFELTDDPTSYCSGPVVSWAPACNSSHGAVCIGDHVVKVGGKDTRRMSALDVSRLLHTKRHKERVVTLSFRSLN